VRDNGAAVDEGNAPAVDDSNAANDSGGQSSLMSPCGVLQFLVNVEVSL